MDQLKKDKYKYLTINLIKGVAWLTVIALIFIGFKTYFGDWYHFVMQSIANRPILVMTTFTLSEVLFGIFPPELFMIWALHQGTIAKYVLFTAMLSLISYIAGVIGYFIGKRFSKTSLYQKLKENYVGELEGNVVKYGGFMIFIAAVTPVPFSAICMIMGAFGYPFGNFLIIGLSRLARFAAYAYVIWEVNQL